LPQPVEEEANQSAANSRKASYLCDVEKQEGHHESEKTSGFSEGETQDGVLEELTTEGWVTGDTLDQGTEYCSDTDTWS
jgi:hypothetical protein